MSEYKLDFEKLGNNKSAHSQEFVKLPHYGEGILTDEEAWGA